MKNIMKTEIKQIKPGLFRTCFSLQGEGETTVPFNTYEEAEAFERGLEEAHRATVNLYRRQIKAIGKRIPCS